MAVPGTIGLAPTGRREDAARHLFRRSFIEWLRSEFIPWELRGMRNALRSGMEPDRVAFWVESDSGSQVGALASGAAFVTYWAEAARDEGLDLAIGGLLERIWMFAGSVATELGGSGPTWAVVQANYPTGRVAELSRLTGEPKPSKDEIKEGVRFLSRVRGDPDVFNRSECQASMVRFAAWLGSSLPRAASITDTIW